jgi:UDP-glucose 4-epimerase
MDLQPQYEGKRVLVTGAAGFLGSHLVDVLVESGAEVRALDNLKDGRLDNLDRSRDRIDFREMTILERDGLHDVVDGCDFVFHLAANALVPRSASDPDYDFDVNVVGTRNVMEAVRATGAGRMIFTSSAAVYGEPKDRPTREGDPLEPQSPYGGSKLAGEFLLDAYARCYDFDSRRVRLFNTFGPRQRKYVMFDLLEKLRRDSRKLEILGTGMQVRDYNYVRDTVKAILLVGAHPDARGRVFNVSGMRPISIRDVASLIIELTGIDPPDVSYTGQSWPGDVARMIGDTAQLQELGFVADWKLEDGIRELIAWHRDEFSAPW